MCVFIYVQCVCVYIHIHVCKNPVTFNVVFSASKSPHVKSGMLAGSLKSLWRAMTSPAFDFQGDPLQQGGALIVGPGDRSEKILLPCLSLFVYCLNLFSHFCRLRGSLYTF